MAQEDVVFRSKLVYTFGPIAVSIALMWYFRRNLRYHVYERAYAWVLNKFAIKMNKGQQLKSTKQRLFKNMFDYQEQTNKRDLKVLEVGSGSGANFDYFPANTKVVTIDPNPHFVGYIQGNLENCRTVVSADVTKGVAEKMPFENNEFDIVVSTLVLCTVDDVEKALSEIKRVLKQDGLFLFLEHVAADKKTWTWKLQNWLQPVWKIIGDGCDCKRETETFIRSADFSQTSIEAFIMKKFPIFVRPCIVGTAKK